MVVAMSIKTKKLPPYDFILEELGDVVTSIKPMFGAFGLYRDHQILMILRKKEKYDTDTGLWLAVNDGHYDSIRKTIPELRDLEMFGPGPTSWQVLGEDLSNFEEVAFKICELIKKNDVRIGRTPKARLKKSNKKNKPDSSSAQNSKKPTKALSKKPKQLTTVLARKEKTKLKKTKVSKTIKNQKKAGKK